MKKVLICSYCFPPLHLMGSVRVYNFAKYLSLYGNDVTVISAHYENNIIQNELFNNIQVKDERINIPNKKDSEPINSRKIVRIFFLRFKIWNFLRYLKHLYFELKWSINVIKAIKSNLSKNSFDIIISSYGPISSIFLGYYIKRMSYASYWICDLRDMVLTSTIPKLANYLNYIITTVMFKYVNRFTVVSEGQKLSFVNQNKFIDYNKIDVVYNGFSKSKYNCAHNDKIENTFIISYTGDLYGGKRNISVLFNIISELINENKIDIQKFRFIYAGHGFDILENQIHDKKLLEIGIIMNMGFVSRDKAIEVQNNSDLLVLSTWNTHKEQGIITGKFFDYLNSRKNVIAIINGDLPNSELSQLISNLDIGISYDDFSDKNHYFTLKKYILEKYSQKISIGSIPFEGKDELISSFEYINIVQKFNNILLTHN